MLLPFQEKSELSSQDTQKKHSIEKHNNVDISQYNIILNKHYHEFQEKQ